MAESKMILEEIEAQIAELEKQLEDVHGTQTEVYARIVGYYRAIRNWNKGKHDEFTNRKVFNAEKSIAGHAESSKNDARTAQNEEKIDSGIHYEFFMRKTCPNCPPVKEYIKNLEFGGTVIDVDTAQGLKQAAQKGVFSAPTAIFYDNLGNEIGRGHSVEEIKSVIAPIAVVA
ncbi:anaerobic ribonucleoside-triphosphate reductase [Treponema pectinovorum]|uniref:anaerobic ribonucleoside-triphosphate reductase n=1 Tax=Treponema pectinovorum TaxID=164 RepID=UPI003D8E6DAB